MKYSPSLKQGAILLSSIVSFCVIARLISRSCYSSCLFRLRITLANADNAGESNILQSFLFRSLHSTLFIIIILLDWARYHIYVATGLLRILLLQDIWGTIAEHCSNGMLTRWIKRWHFKELWSEVNLGTRETTVDVSCLQIFGKLQNPLVTWNNSYI